MHYNSDSLGLTWETIWEVTIEGKTTEVGLGLNDSPTVPNRSGRQRSISSSRYEVKGEDADRDQAIRNKHTFIVARIPMYILHSIELSYNQLYRNQHALMVMTRHKRWANIPAQR